MGIENFGYRMNQMAIISREGPDGDDMISPGESGGVGVAIDELLAEQCRRWRGRDAKPVEGYLEQHPSLRDDPESVLALIFNEIALREELGESPRADEYRPAVPRPGPGGGRPVRGPPSVASRPGPCGWRTGRGR